MLLAKLFPHYGAIQTKPATFPRPSSYSFGSTVLGQASKQSLNAAVSNPSVRKVKWVPVDLSCFLTKSCERVQDWKKHKIFPDGTDDGWKFKLLPKAQMMLKLFSYTSTRTKKRTEICQSRCSI